MKILNKVRGGIFSLKRIFLLLLVCVMLFAFLPVFAEAADDITEIYSGSVVKGKYPDGGNNSYKFEVTSHTNIYLFIRGGLGVQFILRDANGLTIASRYATQYENGAYILKYAYSLDPGEYTLIISVFSYGAPFEYIFGMTLSSYSACPYGHIYNFDTYVQKPDCEKTGYTAAYCMCGAYTKMDETPALGHDWNYWVTEKEPTQDEPGMQTRKCNRQGCGEKESEELQYGDHCHHFEFTDSVMPTCSSTGSYTYTCSCGDTYVKIRDITPYEHEYTQWVVEQAPTITEDGLQSCSCTLCGERFTDTLGKLDGRSLKTASPIVFGQGITGVFGSRYLTFTVPKDGYITICCKNSEVAVDVVAYDVLNAEGKGVCSTTNRSNTDVPLEQVSMGLAAGTYYLQVGSGSLESSEYTILFTPSKVYETENNDTEYRADRATWNVQHHGFIGGGAKSTSDEDYWCIEADRDFEGRIYLYEWEWPNNGYYFESIFIDAQGNRTLLSRSDDEEDADGNRYITVNYTKGTNYLHVEKRVGMKTVSTPYSFKFWKEPEENPFTDVPDGKYYTQPIVWAVENGITAGMTPTTFQPDSTCTRAQVVTFLWRASGSPKPKSPMNPFVDVVEGSFYYDAVLWAVENGITTGMDSTHFGTASECTRGHVATFLWRAQGQPQSASSANPFSDVEKGRFYYTAVLWAVENGITTGMTPTTFQPNATCTRAQIVTFLYRTLMEG